MIVKYPGAKNKEDIKLTISFELMKKIKLIVADVDGTITNSKKELDSDLKETIKVLKNNGIFFTLASGRNFFYMQDILEELEIDVPYICNNGASIYKKDKRVLHYCMEPKKARYILEELLKYADNFIYYSDSEILSYKADHILKLFEHRAKGKVRLGPYDENCKHEEIYKITLDSGNRQEIKDLAKRIEEEEKDIFFAATEGPLFCVTSKRASKGQALNDLVKILNISKEEVMCFGDNYNDISMLQEAGIGVVMGNGEDKTKAIADYICDNNDNNGVSRFLKEYFKEYFED